MKYKTFAKKLHTAMKIFKTNGIQGIISHSKSIIAGKRNLRVSKKMKTAWNDRHDFIISPVAFGISDSMFNKQRQFIFPQNIKFSILVPLYNTPETFLKEMIASVLNQTYGNWELCLADGSDGCHGYVEALCRKISEKDKRIKYKHLENNNGISANTNECLKMASGDWISLFDHDDLLHPSALYETMKAICENDVDFVYTDEAVFETPNLHKIIYAHFKPDFSMPILETNNFICHFTSFKKSLLETLNLFESNCDGAQDFDLFLKLAERTSKIFHISKCLYYWRSSPTSSASGNNAKPYTTNAGKLALQNHFNRLGINCVVYPADFPNTYNVKYTDSDEMNCFNMTDSFINKNESVFPPRPVYFRNIPRD